MIKYWKNNNIDTSKYNYILFVSLTIERYINDFFHILIDYHETPLFDYYNIADLNTNENFSREIEIFHYNIDRDNSGIKQDVEKDKLKDKLKLKYILITII